MKATLTIHMDNAAFSDDDGSRPAHGQELAQIFRRLALRVEDYNELGGTGYPAMDSNGNKVGSLTIEEG